MVNANMKAWSMLALLSLVVVGVGCVDREHHEGSAMMQDADPPAAQTVRSDDAGQAASALPSETLPVGGNEQAPMGMIADEMVPAAATNSMASTRAAEGPMGIPAEQRR